jgi:hypothetical protein
VLLVATVVALPVSNCMALTCAEGTIAPVGSVTVPVIEPYP